MKSLKINRGELRYKGKDYHAGDVLTVSDELASTLIVRYGDMYEVITVVNKQKAPEVPQANEAEITPEVLPKVDLVANVKKKK